MSKFTKRNSRSAKINKDIVADMRDKYQSGAYTQGSLARMFGLSVIQVGRIVRGESWVSEPMPKPTATELDEIGRRMANLALEVQGGLRDPLDAGTMSEESDGSGLAKLREAMKLRNGSLEGLEDDKKELFEIKGEKE